MDRTTPWQTINFPWPMGRTILWQAIISPWGMGRTAPYDPWVMENLFPMGHGSYDSLANYKFPMAHGSYDSLASYNFPMGHGSYGTVRSMGHGEFISHGAWVVRHRTIHGSWRIYFPWGMGRTTSWQAVISPWGMGRTAPYDPWVMENLFPMGHGSYDALENYKFPMAHGSYDSLANYNFPMGHGSYGTVRSMGHGEFISHGAWVVRHRTIHGSWRIYFPWGMGRTTSWQAVISPWGMGRTAPYDPWVMENLF